MVRDMEGRMSRVKEDSDTHYPHLGEERQRYPKPPR